MRGTPEPLTWHGVEPAPWDGPDPVGWLRVAWRAPLLGGVMLLALAVSLALRPLERRIWGLSRPVTSRITQGACRAALAILGLRLRLTGRPMEGHGAMVANHASWLDIFALNAKASVYFVSKAEVAGWPGIGWLARATGTVFIRRERREAAAQVRLMRERLAHGHRLVFFPEGTSTDGRRVLPFKATLFAAFLSSDQPNLEIQPVSVVYRAPRGRDARFYGWWGDMEFGPHMLRMLSARRHGRIEVIYHPALRVADHPDRKALARKLEGVVRAGLKSAGALEQPAVQPAMAEA